jgi:hypothetical protein
MKKNVLYLICLVSIVLLTSCGTSYYVPNRPYGYKPDFSRTYSDRSTYRPNHYRNFIRENSQYLNDPSRHGATRASRRVVNDDTYRANTYVDTHAETGKPIYHTTYTTSYNDNGEVTTTYTTDYVGTKKEEQYWNEVRKEQKKAYKESRKKKKLKIKDMDE